VTWHPRRPWRTTPLTTPCFHIHISRSAILIRGHCAQNLGCGTLQDNTMTFAVLKSRTTYVRLATLFIILSTYKLIIVLWSQTVFEHSLSSLYIISEDFSLRAEKGSNYTEALLAAGKDYFNFTYPPLDSNPHFTIPPKIHFIFFPDLYAVRPSGPVIAHAGSDAPSICIDRNPNFTIKIWDTNEARRLLEDHYAWFLPVYRRLPPPHPACRCNQILHPLAPRRHLPRSRHLLPQRPTTAARLSRLVAARGAAWSQ
jgi:hypothetical protein